MSADIRSKQQKKRNRTAKHYFECNAKRRPNAKVRVTGTSGEGLVQMFGMNDKRMDPEEKKARLHRALADLYELPPEMSSDTCEQHLRRVANYPQYFLLHTADGMPTAPDDDGRRLAAIFTSEAAREIFRQELKVTAPLYTTVSGAEMFPRFRGTSLDAIIFNCSGPQNEQWTFTPDLLKELCTRIETGFDYLATVAFPDGAHGPTEALDALWTALFDLKEWYFAVAPEANTNPYPFISTFNGKRCAFAFTDPQRSWAFCSDNDLLDPLGKASSHIAMPLPQVLEWIRQAGENEEFEIVHFNFGELGWFCPVSTFPGISRRLNQIIQ